MHTHQCQNTNRHVHNAHLPAVLVNVRGGRAELLEPAVVMALVVTVQAWAIRFGTFARMYVRMYLLVHVCKFVSIFACMRRVYLFVGVCS